MFSIVAGLPECSNKAPPPKKNPLPITLHALEHEKRKERAVKQPVEKIRLSAELLSARSTRPALCL